jgi:hypothetical protein
MKMIRDGDGRIIGKIKDAGSVVNLFDGATGHLKGRYVRSADKTFDYTGKFVGYGDQLMRLLD